MSLLLFLASVFIISFTGAMQPGPVTATAVSLGPRNRHAGILLAVGHGIIEFPLMILIMLGVGAVFEQTVTKIVIGIAGGAILLIMAEDIFHSSVRSSDEPEPMQTNPITAGIVLTAANPYFLLWWATVGLALATEAAAFGIWAFALFALVHWFVDLLWVEALSLASYHGTTLLGPKLERIILRICAVAMFFFGAAFIYRSYLLLTAVTPAAKAL